MKNEVKMKLGTFETINIDTLLAKGFKLEERADNRQLATVALLTWCGAMSIIGSIFLAINDVGLVFTGTLVGGGLIIIAVFTNVTDIYLVWNEPKKEKTDAEKGLDALFDDCYECKLEYD